MTVNFGRWHSCATEKPKKDGVYLVLGFYKGKVNYAASLTYLTKYGWNVYVDMNGVPHIASKIDFSDDDTPGSHVWCDIAEFVEETFDDACG